MPVLTGFSSRETGLLTPAQVASWLARSIARAAHLPRTQHALFALLQTHKHACALLRALRVLEEVLANRREIKKKKKGGGCLQKPWKPK